MNVDGFRRDILAEPAGLRSLSAAYAAPGSPLERVPVRPRVLFLGMGSSRYAAMPAVSLLRAAGVDAHAEQASAGIFQPPSADTLVVAISAGGRSPETLAAAARHAGGNLVAVTNDPASPLAQLTGTTLPLGAGDELGGIACRTYQATVAVLLLLCSRLAGYGAVASDLEAAAAVQERLFATEEAWLPALADAVAGGAGVWVAAPAERIGSAMQAALMLREAPRIVAAACETGDWSHVDVYLTKRPGYRLLLLAGSEYEAELRDWQRKRGFTLVAVGGGVPGAAVEVAHGARGVAQTALVEISVVELLAAELWRRHPI
ncbi:MAG TPA: SIS domain-containing protein [Gaiellales bacterium]|nr:SIS domain-containing protein [Gaiellales bacterium]